MTSPEQIDQWLKAPSENQHLEFKVAREQYDTRKASEYCVALANEGGGHLLLGVTDTLPRKVVGTRALRDAVKAADKLFQVVGFRVNIEEVEHPQGRVLVFEVPSRPRGTAYHLDGRYLMRSGASLVPMSEDQLRRIFAEGAPDWLDEPAATNLSAQQVVELLNTKTYFKLLNQPHPSEPQAVVERLVSERMVDRETGAYSIRRLGALLLAENLEDFPDIRRKAARVFGPLPFGSMGRDHRIRACYQHCALRWVMGEQMTNQSLRERFKLAKSKTASVSQIIAATMDAELIKPTGSNGQSRKYARYAPFWA